MRFLIVLIALALLAACNGDGTGDAADSGEMKQEEAGDTAPSETANAQPTVTEQTAPDAGALNERQNPQRLLVYIAAAIAQGKWADAALAWHDGEADAAWVQAQFGAHSGRVLSFGTAEVEGAAGSLYYEVPMELLADNGAYRRAGKITLRRVNDVPGADERQLAWHVEQIEWNERVLSD